MEKAKQASKSLFELAESYSELQKALKTTAKETAKTKKLWREGNKSNLIKIGVACIMFPDPSPVGEIIGTGFIVAGAVQKGIQKRTLYVSDLKKNLELTLREINSTQCNLRT
jgi:6-phosphogluconate dehydrogenase